MKTQSKICLVTDEVAGPDYNGGIGTACRGLATALASAGHAVDVLYTRVSHGQVSCFVGDFQAHCDDLARHGVRLISIWHRGAWNDFPGKSYAALNHLQSGGYDLVFFNDTHGTGLYPLLSRRTGNPLLAGTRMCVVTHSATQWILDLNGEPVTSVESIRLMEMERKSIELADVVLSPSAYLVHKYKGYGWRFPTDTQVRRYILPPGPPASRRTQQPETEELVFFGRLERRKGIDLFCNALDRVKYLLHGKTVSFLGKDTTTNGASTLERVVARSGAWPFEIRVMPNFPRDNALAYLRGGRRVAVMPSLEDNSPCAIQECLELGIPFIASSGSGGEELIAPEDRARCCFAPTVPALARKIAEVVEQGPPIGRLSFDPRENERDILDWVATYLSNRDEKRSRKRAAAKMDRRAPSITLIVAGCNNSGRSNAVVHLNRLATAFEGGQRAAVLCTDSTAPASQPGERRLCASDYEEFARGVGSAEQHFVAIWDSGLELNHAWLLRARNHLMTTDCDAVTGLVSNGLPPEAAALAPHVSPLSAGPGLRQPVVGFSTALQLLSQETNSGFVLMRSSAFQAARNCLPWDPVYLRLKRPGQWIEAILNDLQQRGRNIALIPDLPAVAKAEPPSAELFQKGNARRLAAAAVATKGSASALLHRFAVDRQADLEVRQDALALLEHSATRTSVKPDLWQSARGSSNAHLDQVVAAAFATGQVELAKESLTYLASRRSGRTFDFSSDSTSFWKELAEELSLAALVERGHVSAANHRIPPKTVLEAGTKAILLAANPLEVGLTWLSFKLDLSDQRHFRSSVRALNAEDAQLRFYIAIAAEGAADRMSKECLVSGNTPVRFDFALPDELKRPCIVSLVIESRDSVARTSVHNALWINPCFTRNRPN